MAMPWPLVFTQNTFTPMISSTSPYRLQRIYYSCVSATIRLSKILVHTPLLAPLPQSRGPGHIRLDFGGDHPYDLDDWQPPHTT